MSPRRAVSLTLAILACPAAAVADPPVPVPPAAPPAPPPATVRPGTDTVQGMTVGGASAASYTADWLVNPLRQLEVSAELRFLTSPESPFDGRELRFTDVGLFRAAARYSFGGSLEASAAVDLLAKQPSYLDEPVLAGGEIGARHGLAERWALWARAAGGPLMADLGAWGEAGAGVQARTSIDETIRFQASLGAAGTRLFRGDEDGGDAWFTEAAAHGEASLRTPHGEIGGWLGADYRIPFAHGDGSGPSGEIDPQVRLGFQIGVVIGYVDRWDLYAVAGIVDRGDIEDPATTVPILDGGFDQTQILFGAARRFDLFAREEIGRLQIARR